MDDYSGTKNAPRITVLGVGPQRTASSWLDHALRAHSRLVLPKHVKETFFFDFYFERGWEWYRAQFDESQQGTLKAEVCSTYFESAKARERIRAENLDMRIIITVRNPVTRTFSSFVHEYAKGRAGADFFKAVAANPRIIDSGRYKAVAPLWESDFNHENILYLVQDDIKADPQGQFDVISDFLGVERMELPDVLQVPYGEGSVPRYPWLAAAASRAASALRKAGLHGLAQTGKRLGLKRVYSGGDPTALSMTRPNFDYLLAEHESDIQFLEERLSRSFSHWRNPAAHGLEWQ